VTTAATTAAMTDATTTVATTALISVIKVIVVTIKTNRPTRSNAREIGHVNLENPRPLRWSEFPITFSTKDHLVHIPDPELIRWSLTP
jgi:hypothetical protein